MTRPKHNLLTNGEMAQAFGGYDFQTNKMRNVCKAQAASTLKAVGRWLESRLVFPYPLPERSDVPVHFSITLGDILRLRDEGRMPEEELHPSLEELKGLQKRALEKVHGRIIGQEKLCLSK